MMKTIKKETLQLTEVLQLMSEDKVISAKDSQGVEITLDGDKFVVTSIGGNAETLETSDFAVEWTPVYEPFHQPYAFVVLVYQDKGLVHASKAGYSERPVSLHELMFSPEYVDMAFTDSLIKVHALQPDASMKEIWNREEGVLC